MKEIGHKLVYSLLGILLLLAFLPMQRVRAEAEEGYFANLGAEDEFLVYIEWENSQPLLQFRSPQGVLYDPFTETEGTRSTISDKACYYYIEDAEKGRWNVIYDKLDNENIYITLESVTPVFLVENVTVDHVTGNSAEVGFEVSFAADRWVNYQISVSANEDSEGRVIKKGSCNTNERQVVSVDLSDVSSYGEYRVYVRAWYDKDGVEIFEGAYSKPFRYTNENQTEMLTPVQVELWPEELMARVHWEPKYGYVYLVSIFEDGADQPSSFSEIRDTSVMSYDLSYHPDAQTIEVRIAEKYRDGHYSDEKSFVCDLGDIPEVNFDEAPATNREYVNFHYKGFREGRKVELTVNDEMRQINLSSREEGDIRVQVKQDINQITLAYYLQDDLTVKYTKEIYYHNDPPRIYMMEDYTEVVTVSTEYKILGTVTGADRLLIGGTEAEIGADGSFSRILELSQGENIVLIEAEDTLGNRTVYTAKIICQPKTAGGLAVQTPSDGEGGSDLRAILFSWLPGILALIVGVVILILAAMLPKNDKKDWTLRKIRKVLLAVFVCNLAFEGFAGVKWYLLRVQTHSLDFVESAYASINSAAALLKTQDRWKACLIYGSIGLGVWIVLFGILLGVEIYWRKRLTKSQTK